MESRTLEGTLYLTYNSKITEVHLKLGHVKPRLIQEIHNTAKCSWENAMINELTLRVLGWQWIQVLPINNMMPFKITSVSNQKSTRMIFQMIW